MSPPSIIGFGFFLFVIFAECQAQAPLQFKSFSDIPQALLDQLSSSQIQNIKNALSGGSGGGSTETFQIGGGGSNGDKSTGGQNSNEDDSTGQSYDEYDYVEGPGYSGNGSPEGQSPGSNGSPGGQSYDEYEYVEGPGYSGNGSPEGQSPGNAGSPGGQSPGNAGSPGGQSPGGNAPPQQKTFQFSSFSQIPQSLLDMLPPDQVENLRNQIPATGKMPSQQQPQTPAPNPSGGSSPGMRTFQFKSFSDIPQSLLDQLSSDQIENLKNQIPAHGQVPSTPKQQIPSSPNGGSPSGPQTFHFNSFSEIPQSLLDKLSSDQIENLRNQIPAHGFVPSQQPSGGIPSSSPESTPTSSNIPTFRLGGGSPGGNPQPGRTLQFSKFSDIPTSVLDKLSSDQIENIKKLLSQQNQPVKVTSKPTTSQPNQQTFEFSSFSQIPNSILSQFSSDQIRQIKETLQNEQSVVQLPGKSTNQFEFNFPQGTSKRENDFLNIVFNYVAAGGYLTGIPPVDLLLIRFYIQMGPKNYCG